MKDDGSIVLQMFIGGVLITYKPDHAKYENVKKHLETEALKREMKPGDSCSCPAFS